MVKLSKEEEAKETADWFKGLVVITVLITIAIIGYFAVTHSKTRLSEKTEQIQPK